MDNENDERINMINSWEAIFTGFNDQLGEEGSKMETPKPQ